MEKGVSLIICTYNRSELLKQCLHSFTTQSLQLRFNMEFIIVDNNSSDNTKEIVINFETRLPNLKYVIERSVGLSYARNRGIDEAKYNWVCYVDDDAKVHADFIERMFYVIEHFEFDVFGGMFYPWYRTPKPAWLPNDFGKMRMLRDTTGPIKFGQTVAGGIAAYKKDKLIAAGKFPVDIGMRGTTVGFGEEDFVIRNMWSRGNIIGFDPLWKMDHLVAEYKYTIKWQLKRSFAKGRDAQLKNGSLTPQQKVIISLRAVATVPFLLVKNIFSFFTKNYYRENYLLDSFRYSFRMFGKVSVK